jgi:hypothetical protein
MTRAALRSTSAHLVFCRPAVMQCRLGFTRRTAPTPSTGPPPTNETHKHAALYATRRRRREGCRARSRGPAHVAGPCLPPRGFIYRPSFLRGGDHTDFVCVRSWRFYGRDGQALRSGDAAQWWEPSLVTGHSSSVLHGESTWPISAHGIVPAPLMRTARARFRPR